MSRKNRAIRRQTNHARVGPYETAPDAATAQEETWERVIAAEWLSGWNDNKRDAPRTEPFPNRVVLRDGEIVKTRRSV